MYCYPIFLTLFVFFTINQSFAQIETSEILISGANSEIVEEASNKELRNVAQPSKGSFLRLNYQRGRILNNGSSLLSTTDLKGNSFKEANYFSIEYGKQMLGDQEWHQVCNYPRTGIGFQYLKPLNRAELGNIFSIYGFYDGNYFFSEKFQLTNRMGLGLTYNSEKFDENDPIPNDVFSTKLNVFIELGGGISVKLGRYVFVEPGFRFTHISNGNRREPQTGYNGISWNLGVRSLLSQMDLKPAKRTLEKCLHRHEIIGFVGAATKQLDFINVTSDDRHETYGINYFMTNLLLGYQFETTRRLKLGGGFDFFFDGTAGQIEAAANGKPSHSAVSFRDKLGISLFIGAEVAIDRLSMVYTLEYVIYRKPFTSSISSFEQRIGIRYFINEIIFAGLNVRAIKFRSAKALEFNVGARFRLG